MSDLACPCSDACPAQRVLDEAIVLLARVQPLPPTHPIDLAGPEGHHLPGFGVGIKVKTPWGLHRLVLTPSDLLLRRAGLYDAGLCDRCLSGIAQYVAARLALTVFPPPDRA